MDCRDGACGTCKRQCEQGDYTLGSYIEDAMTGEKAAQGFVLTCQMKVQSDCVIRVPASSASCKVEADALVAQMAEVKKLSPSTIGFSIKLAEANALAFLPGQYVNVSVPGTTQTRSYSLSSMPKGGVVEFLVRNIPGGLMSGYLADKAGAGDALTITGPIGSFYLREVRRPILFLASGTGLAPFLAMLEVLQASGSRQSVHLIYGVTNDVDLVEVDKLNAFAKAVPGFTFATVVADPASSHPLKGYVTHHLPDAALHGGDVDVYLCGPPPMVDAVRNHLNDKGVKPANFYFEKCSPSENTKGVVRVSRRRASSSPARRRASARRSSWRRQPSVRG
jgi:benzoate/toluate 1,2-dioxygenase reductase component